MYINLNSPPAYLSSLVWYIKGCKKHLKIIIKICSVVSTNICTTLQFNTIFQLIRGARIGGCVFQVYTLQRQVVNMSVLKASKL